MFSWRVCMAFVDSPWSAGVPKMISRSGSPGIRNWWISQDWARYSETSCSWFFGIAMTMMPSSWSRVRAAWRSRLIESAGSSFDGMSTMQNAAPSAYSVLSHLVGNTVSRIMLAFSCSCSSGSLAAVITGFRRRTSTSSSPHWSWIAFSIAAAIVAAGCPFPQSGATTSGPRCGVGQFWSLCRLRRSFGVPSSILPTRAWSVRPMLLVARVRVGVLSGRWCSSGFPCSSGDVGFGCEG